MGDVVTAIEALTRYHAAEKRLAEVEAQIDAILAWRKERDQKQRYFAPVSEFPPCPPGELQALYLERERLQAESFRVYMAARRAS